MRILLSIFLFVTIICIKNYESKSCPKDNPFLSSDNVCSNFSDICIKSDAECKRLLALCDQCPPNNLTISYLSELLKTNKDTWSSTRFIYKKLDGIFENNIEFSKVNISNGLKSIDKNFETLLILCKAILGVVSIATAIMLLENRFKLITKFCKCFKFRKDPNYVSKYLQSRKYVKSKKNIALFSKEEVDYKGVISEQLNEKIEAISKQFDEKIGTISEILNKNFEVLQNQIIEFKDDRSRKIKFTIFGENTSILLRIYEDDTVVFVKDQIYAEWLKSKDFDYKTMKLKCEKKPNNYDYLNNNDYLLSQISLGNDSVICEIDPNIKNQEKILVLQIKGIHRRNAFLQVEKKEKIEKLKEIIKSFIKLSDFCIYRKDDKKFTELTDGEIIEKIDLKDKDFIYIVNKEKLKPIFQPIFGSTRIESPELSNTDKISSFYKICNEHLRPCITILIMNSQYLDENDFIFQHNISSDSSISYCKRIPLGNNLKSLEGNTENYSIDDKSVAYDNTKQKNVFVRRFSIYSGNNLKENNALIKELSIFNVLKGEKKFVKIEEPYFNDDYLYIPMEFMKDGSLENFLKERNDSANYVNEDDIINWSKQILDALILLKNNNIIHRNLKTSNIMLVDENRLKLSNFGLSKYVNDPEFTEAMKGFLQTNFKPSRHLAPEMKGKSYGNKIDIWSFGVVLLEMNNGKSIFPDTTDSIEVMLKLEMAKNNEDIKYTLREDTSKEFKDFISCCLEIDPSKRSSAEDLKKHKFLNR